MLVTVLFGRLPGDGLWVVDLSNAAHGPAFAVVTLVVWALLRDAPPLRLSILGEYSLAVTLAILLGALVELLQLLVGRDASYSDLWHDVLGALAAAGCLLALDSRTRTSPSSHRLRVTGYAIAAASTVLMLAPLGVSAGAYLQRIQGSPR